MAARGRANWADSTTSPPAGMRWVSSMTKRRCSSAATSGGASAAARVCARSTARSRSRSRATASAMVVAPACAAMACSSWARTGAGSTESAASACTAATSSRAEKVLWKARAYSAASCSPAVASSSIGTQRCTAAVSPSLASDARACWIDRRASAVWPIASNAWPRCASVRPGDFSTPLPRACRAASVWAGEASAGNDHGRSAAVAWPTARASNRPARVVRRATDASLDDSGTAHPRMAWIYRRPTNGSAGPCPAGGERRRVSTGARCRWAAGSAPVPPAAAAGRAVA